ncbi:glycosyltransferase family 2 protein [Parabacteroides bouchesdurhonensis]|uniref:glycosyltransferase family 2 protein n=1 Tax=Parabacteroides bouchesdurhonensis TaxID=1936995 RepID=UPI000C849A22|nr:glycosyltransferase family 2 protein [Parabacteroides bouchesdurhonensis]
MLISFVIPVYRNENALILTYRKVKAVLERDLSQYEYEFIFVNDGSDDNSLDELLSLRQQDNKVQVISFSRNFGQVAAMIAGYKYCRGDVLVSMSADLQDPAENITKMIRKWEAGNEIVICHRIQRNDGLGARIGSKIFYSLMHYVSPRMPKGGFDFFCLDRCVVDCLNKIDERNRFLQGDILWMGYNIVMIPYERVKREIGKSQWTLRKKVKLFIDSLIAMSYLPIRIMSLLGIIVSLIGFIYSAIVFIGYFYNETPFKGWTPIMMVILIIGGLLMLMLGIIGEYLWRILDETRKRPLYIIKEKYLSEDSCK